MGGMNIVVGACHCHIWTRSKQRQTNSHSSSLLWVGWFTESASGRGFLCQWEGLVCDERVPVGGACLCLCWWNKKLSDSVPLTRCLTYSMYVCATRFYGYSFTSVEGKVRLGSRCVESVTRWLSCSHAFYNIALIWGEERPTCTPRSIVLYFITPASVCSTALQLDGHTHYCVGHCLSHVYALGECKCRQDPCLLFKSSMTCCDMGL